MLYAFTSCALNYTPKSRALLESLRKHAPDIKVCLALADELADFEDELLELYDHVFPLSDFPELNTPSWIFPHRIVELCTAIKPFVLRRILDLPDCEGVFYFDPDMVIFEPLTEMIAELRDHDILLTPHLTDPETTLRGIEDNELSALRHGTYNLGYVGVRNTEEGRRFADWWSYRLKHYCREDIPAGIFTDQKWIDLVPGFFDNVSIMRHPGYNVASWNMTNRFVKKRGRMKYTVNDRPLVFYHFTGFDSGDHDVMSSLYSKDNKDVANLVKWYRDTTAELAKEPMAKVKWAYWNYEDGTPIPAEARTLYRQRKDLRDAFPDPFKTEVETYSYRDWYVAEMARIEALENPVQTAERTPAEGAEDTTQSATGQSADEASTDVQPDAVAADVVRTPIPSIPPHTALPPKRTHPMLRPVVVPMRMMNSEYRGSIKRSVRQTFRLYGLKGVMSLVFGR